jgi:hypothetical protein
MRRCNLSRRINSWEIDGLKYQKSLKAGKKLLFNIKYRTDNAIKNHFYSSLRKNISRISKDVVTLDQKLSP